ncbi:hypothetical protein BDN67DRAFT_985372 [Paxillus ammoniavirescens]|nr:hypothetical protein BDN67DRAFT_985372 [Paxillus ammoniavirescens]
MLSSILKPTAPINPLEAQKSAAKDAFTAAAAKVHAVAMSRPGDSEGLDDERRMWMEEWRAVTPGMMAAHKQAQEVGLETPIPPTVLQEMNLADEAFKKMQDAVVGPAAPLSPARVGSPMAQDPADEPPRASSQFPSISSWATGHSKMEVVINKGNGRKRSRQDLTQEETGPVIPKGMTLHVIQCAKCKASKMPCIGPAGMSCQKCTTLKHKCMYAETRPVEGGRAQIVRPLREAVSTEAERQISSFSRAEQERFLVINRVEVKNEGKEG